MTKALLALADGNLFWGESIGAHGSRTGEVVFNTAITGYQEILTDPSYTQQIVTLTYPHIGNTGINDQDNESSQVMASGLVIKDLPKLASNWRNTQDLSDFLKQHGTVAIADIDTRRLTRILRDKGAQNACLISGNNIDERATIAEARGFGGLKNLDLAKEVTTEYQYHFSDKTWDFSTNDHAESDDFDFHVVVYDYGVKRNILRMLVDRGCQLTVVPAQTSADEVLAIDPDGVFLSNGPGDPEPCDYAQAAIRQLLKAGMPLFGICLGHQLLALACGAKTKKMKFGHHGANHPVQDLNTKQVTITSQNHGFVVDESSLPSDLLVTHRSLFDQTVQGIRHQNKPAISFQGHPEASPGPQDTGCLFDDFIDLIKNKEIKI